MLQTTVIVAQMVRFCTALSVACKWLVLYLDLAVRPPIKAQDAVCDIRSSAIRCKPDLRADCLPFTARAHVWRDITMYSSILSWWRLCGDADRNCTRNCTIVT